jgi:hypothetical protein
MGKKIFGIFVCLLFILATVSTVAAKQERTVYKNCYIEVEAQSEGLYNMVKYFFIRPNGNTSAFVFYWILQWMGPDDVTMKIFNQKNGNELWNNQNQEGIWATKLFFFKGLYTWSTENGQDIMILQGTTRATIILWDE